MLEVALTKWLVISTEGVKAHHGNQIASWHYLTLLNMFAEITPQIERKKYIVLNE